MTRRERLESKLERRREWAEKASQRCSAEFETARKITEGIPFGQPILVGHHSEGAHRRAIERSAGHMDKGWLANWQSNGWRKKDRQPVHNVDLWRIIDVLLTKHAVRVVWVKGHADNPNNNRCDELAVAAAHGENLPPDAGFDDSVRNGEKGGEHLV